MPPDCLRMPERVPMVRFVVEAFVEETFVAVRFVPVAFTKKMPVDDAVMTESVDAALPVAFTKKRFEEDTVFTERVLTDVPVAFTKKMPVLDAVVTVRFVPVAFPKLNPVVAVMVPEAETSKNFVELVDEAIVKIFAVCAARPSKRTVELPTFDACTVNTDVEVAPMPTRFVEVAR